MITLYVPEAHCANCTATKRQLTRKGLEFREIVLTEDHPRREEFKAAGFTAFPIVEVNESDGNVTCWAGFRPDEILALSASRP